MTKYHLDNVLLCCLLCFLSNNPAPTTALSAPVKMKRRKFLDRLVALSSCFCAVPASALTFQQQPTNTVRLPIDEVNGEWQAQKVIAYKQLSLPIENFGVNVPVACWFPASDSMGSSTSSAADTASNLRPACYEHRISVRRIGQLLAGWEFIPEFVSKGYKMAPCSTTARIVDGRDVALPDQAGPVVLLAHGYLGSRFDLSHLAEELAANGFTCIAAEYPESLAASYDRVEGLDRRVINDALLDTLTRGDGDWKLQASAYGIVGHSLGCGTVAQTGDSSWARVSIAGFPRNGDTSNGLFLSSMGDGAVSLARRGGVSAIANCNYEMLQETALLTDANSKSAARLPQRAALVFDRPDAPNHISFLAEGVNDAMIEFLSPLLPVAQALAIPVLDFDRYQISRDSKQTAAIVNPLVVQYLKQEMLPR